MADNERNTPIQDPENLENEIKEPVTPADENSEFEIQNSELEATAEEAFPAGEGGPLAVDEVGEPTETPEVVEEVAEAPAEEEIPVEEAPEEVAEAPAEEAPEVTEQVAEDNAEDRMQNAESEAPTEEEIPEEEPTEAPEEESSELEAPEEPTEEVPEAVEEASAEEPTEEAPADELIDEPAEESADEPAEESDEEPAEAEDHGEISDDDLGKFEIGVDEDGNIFLKVPGEESKSEEQSEESDEYEPEDDRNDVDPEDLIIYDDVVEAIKAEGARLTNDELSLYAYTKHSKDAIRSFESALKAGEKTLDANRDEKESPAILAGLIKICGRILEVKCNNLENFVRIEAYDYIKDARVSLHREIDRYNELVINYSALTGEQLTRMSTFLPENIASGKSLAVVPQLTYIERYVQLLPDEELSREDKATVMPITPALSAEDILFEVKAPGGKLSCWSFARKIKRGNRRIGKECASINKQITLLRASRKKYENELRALEESTPLADRATEEYKNRVFAIGIKYGKQLSGIKTARAGSAFARTRLGLTVNRMALEREKLVLAYEYMRATYRAGSYSQRKAAERFFANAISSYNKCAEITSNATGTTFDQLPVGLIEQTCRGEEIAFPVVAYKRDLIEYVGDNARRISMAVAEEIVPDEQGYSENSGKVLDGQSKIKDTSSLSEESAIVDRASAVAKVMLESLRDSADLVVTADELEQFEVRCDRAIKYFKRARKVTERAISRAFDEHGVVTALIENLRVIANLIEVRRIAIAVHARLNRNDAARSHSRALYKLIELYNGRAIDYTTIVGEQFSRISIATAKELAETADKLKVPIITYKDNYIEVFPKDPLKDSTYEKPRLWRSGVYTPLMMHHYRLTENRSVETTVINVPFVFDVMTDDLPAVSWWHPIGFWQHLFVWTQPIRAWWNRMYVNAEIWFVDESLLFSKAGVEGRQSKNDAKQRKYEFKLKKLNDERDAKILALETVVHEKDRHSASYQKKLYSINAKFSRKVYRLKLRYSKDCTSRNAARLMLERLVLERERLEGINKVLLKYRSYGRITFTPNVLVRYKKKFIDAITAHNKTAEKLSEMVGVKFSQVSTSVADEIIRYGRMIKFPEIVCCREVIETVDGIDRTVGDKWHGYGLYTGTSGSAVAKGAAPIMSVGAMGYATDMGVPFLKADFDGMTMLGMTPGGVPLIGFSQTGETSIPFTGTPMMLAGTDTSVALDAGTVGQDSLMLGAANVADPYSGINRLGIDSGYVDDAEEDAKDIHSGCEVETPLDLETKLIEERFRRSLRARSMTSIDNVANWWKLVGSEINVWFMRKLTLRPRGFLRCLLPPRDEFLEIVNTKVKATDALALQHIARVGGIIEIECKRLYSATKTGIRRSQRVWSAWLHEDIQLYNNLVKEYNSGRERHMQLEQLSLTIPDTIVFRKTDRPPVPPILSLRNRVKLDDSAPSITTDKIYDRLVDYAKSGALRYVSPFSRLWAKWFTIPSIERNYKRGKKAKVLSLVTKVIMKRSARTYLRRQDNEYRHYRIRYEKARSMRRYNNNTLRAVGVASDPIKYQSKVHKALRSYLARNFRIDYNMRIRQLIYRALRIDQVVYWIVVMAFAVSTAIAGIFFYNSEALRIYAMIGVAFAALPILFLLIRFVYSLVLLIASCFLLITRNIWLITYGARDVERNRYGAMLDCFVTEQYRLLLACEKLRQKPKSTTAKKMLIATVNDYNKRAEIFSEKLRVPIKAVETTTLIDKLISGDVHVLNELQNFVYVRELVERVDNHEVGKTLPGRELGTLVDEINQIINSINLTGSDNQIAVDFLEGAMSRLISFLQTDIKPTQNEKYELKRDLIQGIAQFDIGAGRKEIFSKNVITVVDQLGGKDRRRIIGVLAEDDMII